MDYSNDQNMMINKIGSGSDFHNLFNPLTGRMNSNNLVARINQSISMILGTRKGERYFLPDFGSDLHNLVFEKNDYIFQDLAEMYIRDAISTWEPRVDIINIIIPTDTTDNIVPISIDYIISNTNQTVNYVYPYEREVKPLGGDVIV